MLCSNRASLSCSSKGVLRDAGPFAIQTGSVAILFPRAILAHLREFSGAKSVGARTFLSAAMYFDQPRVQIGGVIDVRELLRTGMSALR